MKDFKNNIYDNTLLLLLLEILKFTLKYNCLYKSIVFFNIKYLYYKNNIISKLFLFQFWVKVELTRSPTHQPFGKIAKLLFRQPILL